MIATESNKRRTKRRIGAAAAAVGIVSVLPQLSASPAGAVPNGYNGNWGTEICTATGTSNPYQAEVGDWRYLPDTSAIVKVQVCYWGYQGNLQVSKVMFATWGTQSDKGSDFVKLTGSGGGYTYAQLEDSWGASWEYTIVETSESFPSNVSQTDVRVWNRYSDTQFPASWRLEIHVKLT